MKVAILSTGDELIEGSIYNITAKEISNFLYSLGFEVTKHINVRDNKEDIISSLVFLSNNNDMIIITGGLGSTQDDITRESVANFLNEKLIFNENIYNNILDRYRKYNFVMNNIIKKQAYVIEGATILENKYGSAPGMYINKNNKHYILLPGPPNEALKIIEDNIYIFNKFNLNKPNIKKIQFYNITESKLMEGLEEKLSNINYSTKIEIPIGPSIIFKDSLNKINNIVEYINDKYKDYIIPNNPIHFLVKKLSKENLSISTFESCTGGLVGKLITDIPGSSKIYKGGIIAYSNEIKNILLNVDISILEKYGAVSEETVKIMAKNGSLLYNTNFSIAISGIAGPDGGTKEKPVGTIFFAFFYKNYDKIIVEKKIFSGNRNLIREKAAYYSLIRLLKIFY
ncbi:CinA family nicotinamide mononucleotide deamidase-related protein [Marinitoga litoralis]|uniref:CinA family nicotinamide mononucleotide deamidase-related protein n=1 Tax=Marinitoga litoralis TaxID=570855 RepID=UPI001962274A